MFADTFSFTHTNESHWRKIKYIFPQVHPKLLRNYYFRSIWGDLVHCEEWNFLKSDQSSSNPVPKYIQKWKPVYLGKHNFCWGRAYLWCCQLLISGAGKGYFSVFHEEIFSYIISLFNYISAQSLLPMHQHLHQRYPSDKCIFFST